MNSYLVPANAKKGTLIFSIFRPFDLIMFGSGILVSLLMLVVVQSTDTAMIIISILPAAVTGFLVLPIPNYHNVLCAMQSIFKFYRERRNYIWKGWCFYDKFNDEGKAKK